jgi:HK97 family phage prohead protease
MTVKVQNARRRLAHVSAPALISSLDRDQFEGYASLFGVADGGGDVVARGAFAQSLKRDGFARVRMLYQHFAHEPIGVWEELREDKRGLYVKGRILTSIERGREVLALLNEGALNGLSIGFRTRRARRDAGSGLRTLLDIELWEVSVVTFPLLQGSQITAIGTKKDELANTLKKASTAFRTSTLSSPASVTRKARGAREGNPAAQHRKVSATWVPFPSLSLGRE